MRIWISLICGLFLIASVPATAGYQPGDLYLYSQVFPGIGAGILRVDPGTGAIAVHIDLPDVGFHGSHLTYDRTRDALLLVSNEPTGGVYRVDVGGTLNRLNTTVPTPVAIAARGDGTIYTTRPTSVGYFDVFDVWHPLLDASGTAPVEVSVQVDAMIYDPGSNSLFLFDGGDGTDTDCDDPLTTCVIQFPLVADGTQLSGPIVKSDMVVSTTSERVVGASPGPGSSLMVVVDSNTNDQEPRMQLLDPSSLAFSPYASNGPYTGAAATGAGVYSSVQDAAILFDTLTDRLRLFESGSSGDGVDFASGGLSGAGSGEKCSLIEISPILTAAPEGASAWGFRAVWPNPSPGASSLRFETDRAATVAVEVFDLRGRRVRQLGAADREPGSHQVLWDGRDAQGRPVPAGVYFARLRVGSETRTRKISIVR